MDEEIRMLDLFSGIGGFTYASQLAAAATGRNVRTVAFVEQDKFCQAVLRKNWPGVPIYNDIKTFKTTGLGRIDICAGGFPCTPYSQLGKQRAQEDPRSLWPEMFRIIKECRPTWVVGENVTNLIKLGLDEILDRMEDQNYSTRTFSLPACAVGAPHLRQRLFLIAYNETLANTNSNDGRGRCGSKPSQRETRLESRRSGQQRPLADPDRQRRCRQRGETQLQVGSSFDGLSRWVSGDWERGVPRLEKKQEMRKEKLKSLGNSIVPPLAAEIMEAMFRNWE